MNKEPEQHLITSDTEELRYRWYCKVAGASAGFNLYEAVIQLIYSNLLSPGDTAIDGGSADGRHTVPMANLVGERGLVVAVEPLFTSVYSKRQWAGSYARKNVKVVEMALTAEHGGVANFNAVKDKPGFSSLRQGYWGTDLKVEIIECQLTTIDAVVLTHNLGIPAFIKLDLEGGEYHALLGARHCLSHKRTTIVFEHSFRNAPANFGYDSQAPFTFADEQGYTIFDIFGRVRRTAQELDDTSPHYLLMAPKDSPADAFARQRLPALVHTLFSNAVTA